jgi:hypothetical protein
MIWLAVWTFVSYFGADASSDQNFVLGHPTKNDCSTEVLLDFWTSATFLRSVPERRENFWNLYLWEQLKKCSSRYSLCAFFWRGIWTATNVPSLPAFWDSNCFQSSVLELKEHLNLLIIASCHPFVHSTHGFTQFSGIHHYPRLSLTWSSTPIVKQGVDVNIEYICVFDNTRPTNKSHSLWYFDPRLIWFLPAQATKLLFLPKDVV